MDRNQLSQDYEKLAAGCGNRDVAPVVNAILALAHQVGRIADLMEATAEREDEHVARVKK